MPLDDEKEDDDDNKGAACSEVKEEGASVREGDTGRSQHALLLDEDKRRCQTHALLPAQKFFLCPCLFHTVMKSFHESSPSPFSSGGSFTLIAGLGPHEPSHPSPSPHLYHKWKRIWDLNGFLENPGQSFNSL